MAKGLEIKNRVQDNLSNSFQALSNKHKQTLEELKQANQKASLLDNCNRNRALDKQRAAEGCRKKVSKMQAKVDASETKATIANRGYTLCKGELAASNAQGASMQAEAMKAQSKMADSIANQKAEQEAMKEKITGELSERIQKDERDRYDHKLSKAISKVSKTQPISPKCQACAKLSDQERQVVGANCAECN